MSDFNRYQTVTEIINGAAVECGLAPDSNAWTTTATAFVQLQYLIKTCGLELLTVCNWQQLVKETSITLNYGDSGEVALPSDFERMIPQTGWDRSATVPLNGEITPQQWQWAKGTGTDLSVLDVTFRFNRDYIKILPTPPVTGTNPYQVLYYEYLSRGWVRDGGDSTHYLDHPVNGGDYLLYEPVLLIKMLRYKFLAAKGFDTTAAVAEFTTALKFAVSKNNSGQSLNLVPRATFPFTNPQNITGIGL